MGWRSRGDGGAERRRGGLRRADRAATALLVVLVLAGVAGRGKLAAQLDGPGERADGRPRAAGLAVAVVGPATRVRPDDPVRGARGARLRAARNEFESFQVVVGAADGDVRALEVALAEPLRGPVTIPADHVTIYREDYLDVTSPSDAEGGAGRWPDALVPARDPFLGERRDAFPVDVPARENRVAWVDVLVPADAPRGRYRGALAVRTANGSRRVPVELAVAGWTMPSTSSLRSAFGLTYDALCRVGLPCDGDDPAAWQQRALYVRAALDNRVTVSDAQAADIAEPGRRELFRRHLLPLLVGRGPTRLPGARMTALRVPVDRNLPAWRAEAEAQGFADRAFVYACDEPGDDQVRWEACRAAAAAAEEVWPDVAVLVTGTAVEAERHGAIGEIDVLAPVVNFLEDRSGAHEGDQRDTYEEFLRGSGRELWTYTSCLSFGCGPPGTDDDDPYWRGWPGYAVDAPATQARTPSWLAWRYGLAGELYYDVGLRLDDAWSDQFAEGGNGDGTLFYPGDPARIGGTRPVPVESLRLKLIRDGREDHELLRRLDELGRPADDLIERLVPHAWASSPSGADLAAAHDELVRRVDDAGP